MTDDLDSAVMDPGSSPDRPSRGIRRVNNVPIAILVGAVALFGVVIAYVAVGRAASADRAQSDVTVRSARSVAEEITRPYEAGQAAQASSAATPTSQPAASAKATSTSPLPSGFPAPPPPPGERRGHSDAGDDELRPPRSAQADQGSAAAGSAEAAKADLAAEPDELQQMRLEMFKAAIRSKTSIELEPSTERPRNGNPMADERSDDRYVERLHALQQAGLLPESAADKKSSRGREYGQFDAPDGQDRWRLASDIEAPGTSYELRAGAILPATLTTGINSDLPGQITAIVAQDVRDTATGEHILIPQGCRLVGTYSADIKFGQDRLLVAWQRLVYPDGKALDIGAMPGADGAGYAGFADQVDNHYFRLFVGALLMSGITSGIALSQDSTRDADGRRTVGGAMTESLGQQLGQLSEELIRRQMDVASTIEIRPGYRFSVQVTKDLTFNGPYRPYDYARSVRATEAQTNSGRP